MSFIRRLWADPETMKPVGGPIHLTDDQARGWFARIVDPGSRTDCYRLIINEEGQPIGEISFHRLDAETMTAEFNVKIVGQERGKGYGRQAMARFLNHFFNDFGGRMMVDDVGLDNHRGQEVLLKFGFEHDPRVEEVFRLRMTREQYDSLYGGSPHEAEP